MKHLRFWIVFGVIGMLAAVGSVAFSHPEEAGDRAFRGGSYLVTFQDSTGNFASRAVITLHDDQTMAVADSGQGGPTFFFTSQLGSWKPTGPRRAVGRTIDFNYPPDPAAARLDYSLSFTRDHSQVTGTGTLISFPLENSDPLGSGGTVVGTFSFEGELITP